MEQNLQQHLCVECGESITNPICPECIVDTALQTKNQIEDERLRDLIETIADFNETFADDIVIYP